MLGDLHSEQAVLFSGARVGRGQTRVTALHTWHQTVCQDLGKQIKLTCTRSGNASDETFAISFRNLYASNPVSDKSSLDMSTIRKTLP